jgi:orotidine-5'-phosphate decarboxylase
MNTTANFLHSPKGIILAADVDDLDELRALVDQISGIPEIAAIKLGFSLGLRFGLSSVVKTVRQISSLPVIYDHQKAGTDIPQMGAAFAAVCREAGIDGVIFFPQAGPKTLEGFVSGAIAENLVPIVGLVMSHPAYLQSEGGYIVDDAPSRMAEKALELGVTNFVLPGTKPKVVETFAKGALAKIKATIMMPGIGSQGGSLTAACEAAAPHRCFPIIGSAIYKAKDQKTAAITFAAELKNER